MSAIFLGVYPSGLQSIGLLSSILGATVMSVDFTNPFAKKSDWDKDDKYKRRNDEDLGYYSPYRIPEQELKQYHSHSTEHSQETNEHEE